MAVEPSRPRLAICDPVIWREPTAAELAPLPLNLPVGDLAAAVRAGGYPDAELQERSTAHADYRFLVRARLFVSYSRGLRSYPIHDHGAARTIAHGSTPHRAWLAAVRDINADRAMIRGSR